MSRISLLTKNGEAAPLLTAGEKEPGRAILRDLQLDKTFLLLCPEAAPREALLSVLCSPSVTPEDILHRYRTGQIFWEHPQFLDTMTSIFRRLNQTKNAWDQDRSRLFAHRRTNPSDLTLQLTTGRDVLGLTCMYLRSALAQIREVSLLLENHPDCMPDFAVFKENCDRVWRSHQPLIEFADRCHKLINQACRYDVEYTLDEELRTGGFLLRDFAHIRPQASREKQKPAGLWQMLTRGKGTEETAKPETSLPEIGQPVSALKPETQTEITISAIGECDRYLTAMLRGLLDRFPSWRTNCISISVCSGTGMHWKKKASSPVFRRSLPVKPARLKSKTCMTFFCWQVLPKTGWCPTMCICPAAGGKKKTPSCPVC